MSNLGSKTIEMPVPSTFGSDPGVAKMGDLGCQILTHGAFVLTLHQRTLDHTFICDHTIGGSDCPNYLDTQ